jgi:hypothetical protein
MQKKIVRNSLVATLVVPVIALLTNAAVAGRQDFRIHNRSEIAIVRLYVSSSGTNDWEEDVLRSDILEPGEVFRLNFSDDTPGCMHDLKAIFRNGAVVEEREVNLCKITDFNFR